MPSVKKAAIARMIIGLLLGTCLNSFCLSAAWALPNFARKYKVSCMVCHSAVPRLNEKGYKFRAAGYRMGPELDQEPAQAPKFEDYNAARAEVQTYIQGQWDRDSDTSKVLSQVDFLEAALHPVTGAWGKHWATGAEFAFLKSGEVDIEQAQGRYVFGREEGSFGSIRGGIFHAIEGFGAADKPIGISLPLLQSTSAFRGSTNTLYTLIEPSTAGLTFSYWLGDTNATFNVLNRLGTKVANGEAEASYLSSTSQELGDFLFTLNYIFDQKGGGSGVFLNYYKGQSNIPNDAEAYAAVGTGSTYKNNFQRATAYANYYLTQEWNVLAGVGWGRDQALNPSTGFATDDLDSWGYFIGLEQFWENGFATGVRFDDFRADTATPGSTSLSAAVFANYLAIPEVQLIAEYRYDRTGRALLQPLDEHSLTVKGVFMF